MSKIFKSTAILSALKDAPIPVFTTEEMEAMVLHYWGSAEAEGTFPISFWQLQQLFATAAEVALRVTNIGDPKQVAATWMAFEEKNVPEQDDASYFVLNEVYFAGPIVIDGTPTLKITGIQQAVANAQQGLVIGRLGKDEAGEYHAFFKAAEYQLVNPVMARGDGDGDSGEGGTSGVKIP